ncbi:MAG: hypothetical protein ACM31L_05755 [Actinomycetota bacterium]
MTRPTLSARIAAVCVRGQRCKTITRNPHRLELAEAIISTLLEHPGQPLDAVLLPAGFLRLPTSIADLDFTGRAEALARTRIGRALIRLCRRLEVAFPGILIVTGIDGDGMDEGDDQLCVAFGAHCVVGVARKLFPTDHDTRNPERAVTPRLADYDCPGRIVALPSGRRAALCACYDVFGFHEGPDTLSARSRAIRQIHDGSRAVTDDEDGFTALRRAALANWQARWRGAGVDLALAAIHGFEQPGRDGYWQRHGMACAAAALGGASVGAAHFEDGLPEPLSSTLAAAQVPKAHLKAGPYRRAHALAPAAWVTLRKGGREAALIRLFQV